VTRARQQNQSRSDPLSKARNTKPAKGARRELARKAALARWTRNKMQPPLQGNGGKPDVRAASPPLYQPTPALAAAVVRRLKADEDGGRIPVGTLGRKCAAFVGARVGDDDEQAIARGTRRLSHMAIAEDVNKVYLVACSVLGGVRDRDADPSTPIPNVSAVIRRMESRLKRVLRDWDRRRDLPGPRSHTRAIEAAMFRAGFSKNAPRFMDLRPNGEIARELVALKYGPTPSVIDNYTKEGRRFRKRPLV
jgi:hypothetical protein